MDSSRDQTSKCWNSAYGCSFVSSSATDMVTHFQNECACHPMQCPKCRTVIPKDVLGKHYEQCCKDGTTSPCTLTKEAPAAAEANASATTGSLEEHLPQESVAACMKSLVQAVKDVLADFTDVKAMKEKQKELQAMVKAQARVIHQLRTGTKTEIQKADHVQQHVEGAVNALDEDGGITVPQVRRLDGSEQGQRVLNSCVMDPSGKWTPCKNSAFGCTFGTSSAVDMVKHFQWDCAFHPVRCFKCDKTVQKVNFEKHYMGYCKDNPAPPCPATEDVPDEKGAEAVTTTSPDLHFLRERVTECTLGLENLGRVLKDISADVAEMKGLERKQDDMETYVKGQSYVIDELSTSITSVAEKVNKVQEDVNSAVNRLDKDAETIVRRMEKVNDVVSHFEKDIRSIMQRVEIIEGFLKESFKVSKLDVGNLSHVVDNVKAKIAAFNLRTGEQRDMIKEHEETELSFSEREKKLVEDLQTIVKQIEKVEGLGKKVRVFTRPPEDQNSFHWYLENLSRHIEESKTGISCAKSDIFVLRGYSARLRFLLEKRRKGLSVGLYFALCHGPNDSLLQWPFRIPYTLFLIHPKDASKIKEIEVDPASCTSPLNFEKLYSGEVFGVGCDDLCTLEQLQSEGYIENDALRFALTLHG